MTDNQFTPDARHINNNRRCYFTLWSWCILSIVTASFASAEMFGFRGDGSGRFASAKPPIAWSASENVAWSLELPSPSYGSLAMAGDRLILPAEPNLLICVDRREGKLLWQHKHPDAGEETNTSKVAKNTAATPVTDGKIVATVFGNGLVVCRTVGGEFKWQVQLTKADLKRGHTSSPVLADGKVIVQTNELVGIDIQSGQVAWRVNGLKPGYATPNVVTIDGTKVVIQRDGHMIRASDGEILASQLWDEFEKMNSTIVNDGILYVHNKLDVIAFRLPKDLSGDVKLEQLWKLRSPQGGYPIPSPLYHDGLLYTAKEDGVVMVLDAANGETVFKKRLSTSSRLHPSPFLAGGHIYYGNHRGVTAVVKPGREFEEVQLNELKPTGSSPICDGRFLYIRTNDRLYCLEGGTGGRD